MGTVNGFITLQNISVNPQLMSRDNSPRTAIDYQIRACDIAAETTCQKSSYTTNFDGQARTLESDILLLILMFRQFLQT